MSTHSRIDYNRCYDNFVYIYESDNCLSLFLSQYLQILKGGNCPQKSSGKLEASGWFLSA